MAGVGKTAARVISCLVSLTAVERDACRADTHQQGALSARHYTCDRMNGTKTEELLCVCCRKNKTEEEEKRAERRNRNVFKTNEGKLRKAPNSVSESCFTYTNLQRQRAVMGRLRKRGWISPISQPANLTIVFLSSSIFHCSPILANGWLPSLSAARSGRSGIPLSVHTVSRFSHIKDKCAACRTPVASSYQAPSTVSLHPNTLCSCHVDLGSLAVQVCNFSRSNFHESQLRTQRMFRLIS